METTVQSPLCYSACLIQHSLGPLNFTWFVRIKRDPPVRTSFDHQQCVANALDQGRFNFFSFSITPKKCLKIGNLGLHPFNPRRSHSGSELCHSGVGAPCGPNPESAPSCASSSVSLSVVQIPVLKPIVFSVKFRLVYPPCWFVLFCLFFCKMAALPRLWRESSVYTPTQPVCCGKGWNKYTTNTAKWSIQPCLWWRKV